MENDKDIARRLHEAQLYSKRIGRELDILTEQAVFMGIFGIIMFIASMCMFIN